MARISTRALRRKGVPYLALIVVSVVLVASFVASTNSPNQAFAFGVYWPAPAGYPSNTPSPNVYLGINYTGHGLRNFTYVITTSSTVLTSGQAPVNHLSPFKVTLYAPVPSELQAKVFVQGALVYSQNLTLT